MNKIFIYTIKFFFIITISIFFLEILVRISDQNCYSILPIYFDNGHSTFIKNESFCVKYTGHPNSTYKTDKFGIRVNNKESQNKNFENLLIGDSQAMGYGINFEDHFLFKYLDNNNLGNLKILATPHNDIKSINSFVENNNFKFDKYKKIFIMFNLGIDLDRFVFGWQNNWNISNNYIEIKFSKFLRLYPYIKNIYLKLKKYHFTFRPSVNPYLDFITDQEANYLINEIIDRYLSFLNENKILNYEFIIIAPAWYFDKNQLRKFNYGFENEEFLNLFNDYDYYYNKMKTNLEIISKKLKKDGIDYILIDQLENPERSFLKTDYHLNEIGHDEVFKKF